MPDSRATSSTRKDSAQFSRLQRTARERWLRPLSDDIGTVIATLVSDESRWITGQDIEVSGGYNM